MKRFYVFRKPVQYLNLDLNYMHTNKMNSNKISTIGVCKPFYRDNAVSCELFKSEHCTLSYAPR